MPLGQLIERLIGKMTSKRSRHCTLAAAGLLLGLAIAGRPAYAQDETAARAGAPDSLISVQVVDFTQRFLAFYEAARAEQADADRRWELWQEHYGFSSTPPTAEGRAMQRRLLEEAWPRYPDAIDRIEDGADDLRVDPESELTRVADLLALDDPLEVMLLVFVGVFDGNAFYVVRDGTPVVAIPIEEEREARTLSMSHEFVHAVHAEVADLPSGWERSIAQTIISEGLAMRAVERLEPDRSRETYLGRDGSWMEKAEKQKETILAGIRPHLDHDGSDVVERFTIGDGSAGLPGEAYYAGWIVVGHLLDSGASIEEIARTPSDAMPDLVDRAIGEILAGRQEAGDARR